MPFRVRRILVAVADASARKVFQRATDIARRSAGEMELFSVVRPGPRIGGVSEAQQRIINGALIEARRNELERVAVRLRKYGVDPTCTVVMDHSVTDAILRRALQTEADLVAIEARPHNVLARLLLAQSDYDLIRHCPVPLLIVKTRSAGPQPILAALDPWHVNEKPSGLDARIVEAGRFMANTLGVELHGAHVYPPNVALAADAAFMPVSTPISPLSDRRYTADVRRRFQTASAKYRLAPAHTHLRRGDPSIALPQIVRSVKAQMLVMGAISRSALKRFLIGSTAERVLDAVGCDLLIVKPKSFHDRRAVAERSVAAGQARRRGARR